MTGIKQEEKKEEAEKNKECNDQNLEGINDNMEDQNFDYFENQQNEIYTTKKVKQSLFEQKLSVKEIKCEIGKFLKEFVKYS